MGADHPFLEKRPDYDPSTWLRGARFSHTGLGFASNLYITVEDRLRVLILNQHGSTEVDVNLRLQRPDGQIIPLKQAITTLVSASFQTFELDLTEGFLLDVLVTSATTNVKFGEVFVVVQLIRGTGANAIPLRMLLANYAVTNVSIGWPEGPLQPSATNIGALFEYATVNPAAGADWLFTVPGGVRILIVSMGATLVTSATVANRIPHLQVVDAAASNVFEVATSTAQAASLTVRYSWTGGVQPTVNDNAAIAPIPEPLWLPGSASLKTVTTGLQVGDQWSNIKFYVQQLIES